MSQEPFRFLDLPTELRVQVYEKIEFASTWHVLDRVQARLEKRDWPVPPKAQVYDSRITWIEPHATIDILMTCHLVYQEARPILKRKLKHARRQPIRYLVDYSAAYALLRPYSVLGRCIGRAVGGLYGHQNGVVKNFVQSCATYLSQTCQVQDDGLPAERVIEITITHKIGVVYGMEVYDTLAWLRFLGVSNCSRLVITYKLPLPAVQMSEYSNISHPRIVDELARSGIPTDMEMGQESSSQRGVFLRALVGEAFEEHVQNLEWF